MFKGAHRALRHLAGLSFSFFGMRICTRIIPLRVEPWIKRNHSYPLQTSEQKLGRFFSVGEMQFLTYAVYSAERRNNLKTKGSGHSYDAYRYEIEKYLCHKGKSFEFETKGTA